MKLIAASSLNVGSVTDVEYFNRDGELLIAKGVMINPRHLDALRRRNIFDLYIHDSTADKDLERILTTEFDILDDLEIDDTDSRSVSSLAETFIPPLPGLRDLKFGQEGLTKLTTTKLVADFEQKIERTLGTDKPVGAAFNATITQKAVSERTDEYKKDILVLYNDAVDQVRTTLIALARGNPIDSVYVRKIVERFLKTFATDRNILLNLTNVKSRSDDYLFNHSLNVCILSLSIAVAYGYSMKQVLEIGIGALLHDVGMLFIPAEIRMKKGRLNADEWFEVQKHPMLGLHILEGVDRLPETTAIIAYQAHERDNGSGYPRKRNNRVIHNFSRVVQCADVFEAVCSPRTYRQAIAPYFGMEMLVKMAQQGFLAGDYVKAFLQYSSLFPIGSIVELNDHTIGRVIAVNGNSFTKPVVSVIADAHGHMLPAAAVKQINLKDEPEFRIVKSHPIDFLKNLALMQGF